MGLLTLVRHAQASFHSGDYDVLSPLGERQSRILGEALIRQHRVFDHVFVGPRKRQQQTAQLVSEVYRKSRLGFPESVVIPELDEYDLSEIVEGLAPALAAESIEFASLLEKRHHGSDARERERNFQIMFEWVLRHWQTTGTSLAVSETWPAFRERVLRGLTRMITQEGKGLRIIAFTSGGFIGTATQQVLGAPDHTALEINWRIRNGALTDFQFSLGRLSLDSFNNIAHFDQPELVTFR